MKRLGDVVAVHGAVAVVACTEEPPDLDADVYDPSMDRVAAVVDLIGPTDAPYAVVGSAGGIDVGDRLYLR